NIKLRAADFDLAQSTTTQLRRQQALLEQQAVTSRRQLRTQEVQDLGFSLTELGRVRSVTAEIVDTNRRAVEPLQQQLRIQQLLEQEMKDRIAEEKARQQA